MCNNERLYCCQTVTGIDTNTWNELSAVRKYIDSVPSHMRPINNSCVEQKVGREDIDFSSTSALWRFYIHEVLT